MSIGLALESSDVLRLARDALQVHDPWVVGGTVRDLMMERPIEDVDLVVPGDAEAAARALADAARGHIFQLSKRFGAWRVIDPRRRWQADVTPVRQGGIEGDLALRDFTINAMAVPLVTGGPLIDPHDGTGDLKRRLIRVVGQRSYRDDPLRTLRMARLACELDFAVEQETRRLAAADAPAIAGVAPERVFYELRRLVVSPQVLRGIELIDETELVAAILPELEALKGVEQNPYHHLDVWGHTIAVLECLIEIEADPEQPFGTHGSAVAAELTRPLGDELSRGQALRLAALFHDVGKPSTRRIAGDGRILFWGHDRLGAEMTRAICRRLRTSAALSDFLAQITRHHLRLGFLVHERPLSRRHVFRYLRECEPVELEVTVLSTADRLATRGERTRPEAIEGHIELARQLAGEALAWRSSGGPPSLPVSGDELAGELDIEPGPRLGEILERLREEAFAGELRSRDDAIELARREL